MDADWREVLKWTIPRVEAASSGTEYYTAIAEMTHYAHDAHMVSPYSAKISPAKGMFCPNVAVRIVEDELVVAHAGPETGLVRGEIVRRIDEIDVPRLLEKQSRTISAGSPGSMQYYLAIRILRGIENSDVSLEVEDVGSTLRTVTLARNTPIGRASRIPEVRAPIEVLGPGLGYVDVGRISMADIDPMIERFDNLSGVIFDLRRGGRNTGREILARLVDPKRDGAVLGSHRVRGFRGQSELYRDLRIDFTIPLRQSASSNDHWQYEGQTALLIDESLRSGLEGLASAFRRANGTLLIGSPTQGANGDVTRFTIPGGIVVALTGAEVLYGDGVQQQRVGVMPDILVKPTIEGVRAGRDEILERAIQVLTPN